MVDSTSPAEDLIDELEEAASDEEEVTVGDLLDELGRRSYAPFLMLPPIIEFSPLGGIPGVPTAVASVIALFAVQIVMGKDHLWMPEVVQNRTIKGKTLCKAIEKVRGAAQWLDEHTGERLTGLTTPLAQRLAGVATLLLCCVVPPLELVPFASSAPMAAIALFGLAILARDGVLMLFGLVGTLGVATLGIYLLATGG